MTSPADPAAHDAGRDSPEPLVHKPVAPEPRAPEPVAPNAIAYELSEQIGHLLRRAYQRHTAIFQRRISDLDVTAIQFAVLVAIRDGGIMPLTRIGAATAIDPATLRGVVSRLSDRDLITSQSDEADRRQRLVALTPKGRDLVARLLPDAVEITRETLSPLNPAEVLAIGFLLKKLS